MKKVLDLGVLQKILNRGNLPAYEKLLCITLTVLSGGEKECTPSIKELAELCSCSVRQIQRVAKDLEKMDLIRREHQFIEVEGNAQTSNKFILHFL